MESKRCMIDYKLFVKIGFMKINQNIQKFVDTYSTKNMKFYCTSPK